MDMTERESAVREAMERIDDSMTVEEIESAFIGAGVDPEKATALANACDYEV